MVEARMTSTRGQSSPRSGGIISSGNALRTLVALAAVGVVLAIAGCGGSKPQYCSNRSSLENSIKEIPSLVTSRDLSKLQAQATKIQGEANKLVSSAKSDFPTESSAVSTDVDAFVTAVKGLPSNPTASDFLAVGVKAASAVSAVGDFVSTTKSKC